MCNDNTTSKEKKVDLISVQVKTDFWSDAITVDNFMYSPLEECIKFDESDIDFAP
jgi:hypothetical protein